jgi:hypothetical protein
MRRRVAKWLLVPTVALQSLIVAGCCEPNTILTDRLPTAAVGQAYSVTLESNCSNQRGCDGSWRVTGELPPGLDFFREGRLSGTPTVAGRYHLVMILENCRGAATVQRGFSLTVSASSASGS